MAQKRKPSQADLIEVFQRIVRAGNDDDDDEITLPRHLLVAIADLVQTPAEDAWATSHKWPRSRSREPSDHASAAARSATDRAGNT